MNETILKKEFKKSDVQRIRNIVKKDFTAKTKVISGYSKGTVFRNEGDVWEEDGRTWTLEDGIKRNITKLDSAKEAYKIPLRCPKCKGSMSHWLAKKMFRIHGFCFDCTVEYEANLRKLGKYDDYEQAMMKGNIKVFAKDFEQYVLEKLDSLDSYVTEQGDVEDWKSDKSKVREQTLKELEQFHKYINEAIEK